MKDQQAWESTITEHTTEKEILSMLKREKGETHLGFLFHRLLASMERGKDLPEKSPYRKANEEWEQYELRGIINAFINRKKYGYITENLQRGVVEVTDTEYDHLPKEHLIKIIRLLADRVPVREEGNGKMRKILEDLRQRLNENRYGVTIGETDWYKINEALTTPQGVPSQTEGEKTIRAVLAINWGQKGQGVEVWGNEDNITSLLCWVENAKKVMAAAIPAPSLGQPTSEAQQEGTVDAEKPFNVEDLFDYYIKLLQECYECGCGVLPQEVIQRVWEALQCQPERGVLSQSKPAEQIQKEAEGLYPVKMIAPNTTIAIDLATDWNEPMREAYIAGRKHSATQGEKGVCDAMEWVELWAGKLPDEYWQKKHKYLEEIRNKTGQGEQESFSPTVDRLRDDLKDKVEKITKANKRIASLEGEQKWISVEGGIKLEEDELCLIVISGKTQPAQFRRGNFYRYPNHIEGDRCGSYYYETESITHYQPLPSPPSPKDSKTDV
jgi:hypothetical protein